MFDLESFREMLQAYLPSSQLVKVPEFYLVLVVVIYVLCNTPYQDMPQILAKAFLYVYSENVKLKGENYVF